MEDSLPRNLKPLDLMLMREMAIDATQTATAIAKKLGKSRSTVQWRLQELLDNKIIKIVPVHDPVTIGYKIGILIGLKVVPSKVNNIARKMALVENVHNVIICGGRYDIILGAVFQDMDKLSHFLINELSSISGVTSTETMVTLRVVKASFTFMTSEECPSVDVPVKRNIDALDLMIIRELQTNPKQSQAEIAKKIGAGTTTVRRRLNRLLDDRIIRIVAIADPRALGYQIRAAIGIRVCPDKIDTVADKLASYANVHYALITTGPYNLVVWAVFRDTEELSNFIRHELGNIEGLVNYECMLTLKVTKDIFSSPTRNL